VADVGFLLAEDEALKAKLSSLTVPDPSHEGGDRRVQVWYGMPSTEREAIFPFITIDLIDVVFAAERAHSLETVAVDWWPSTAPTFAEYAEMIGISGLDPAAPYASTILFQPYDLYYQVSTHCRYARQDRRLTAQLISYQYLPLNNLGTLHVPADDTQRWLDNMGQTRADYLDPEGKPVWRKVYTLKVSAHMPVTDPEAYLRVLQVGFSLRGIHDGEEYASWDTTADV